MTEVGTLLPWNSGTNCGQIVAGLADAVFGVASPSFAAHELPRQRLGIRFEMAQDGGARVLQVEKGSIAEAAGIRDSDVITEAAGVADQANRRYRGYSQTPGAGNVAAAQAETRRGNDRDYRQISGGARSEDT